MPSRRQKAWNLYARWVQKPGLALPLPVPLSRALADTSCRLAAATPPGLRLRREVLRDGGAEVPAWRCDLGGETGRGPLLYLHGGGFVLGSPRMYRHLVARLADGAGMTGWLVDYRRAPEHPFPAALDDARTAWRALLAQGADPGRLVLAGDSAGGNLALALLHRILEEGGPPPAAAAVFSPVTDLTGGSPSLKQNLRSEMLVPANWARRSLAAYVAGADPRDPRLSPLFGRFDGAGPVLIQYAAEEMLADDSRRMAEALRAQGVVVTLDEWREVPHVWHLNVGRSPEADRAVAEAARFLGGAVARAGAPLVAGRGGG